MRHNCLIDLHRSHCKSSLVRIAHYSARYTTADHSSLPVRVVVDADFKVSARMCAAKLTLSRVLRLLCIPQGREATRSQHVVPTCQNERDHFQGCMCDNLNSQLTARWFTSRLVLHDPYCWRQLRWAFSIAVQRFRIMRVHSPSTPTCISLFKGGVLYSFT